MNPNPLPLFIIAGATAVGKSTVAAEVAEQCGGEILSADAFQIYEGLDILTAKPSPALRARAPHHLIGEIPLTQSFDVAQFLGLARPRITAIRDRGRVPIIVGGTGLYLRALSHGLADLPAADATLRTQFEAQSTDDLGRQFAELDPTGHTQIDRRNRRRVIRALEVCLLTGRPFSDFREEWTTPTASARGVALVRSREELHARIQRRTVEMFAAGVVEEVRAAGEIGKTARQTLGWREITALLAGTFSFEECMASIEQATRRYAKRQATWFRRETHLGPLEITGEYAPPELIKELVQRVFALI